MFQLTNKYSENARSAPAYFPQQKLQQNLCKIFVVSSFNQLLIIAPMQLN